MDQGQHQEERTLVKFPSGLEEIKEVYGDPEPLIDKETGIVDPKWEHVLAFAQLPEPLKLGWVDKSVSRIRCHHKLVPNLTYLFGEIHRQGWWYRLKTFDGCYAWRNIRRAKRISTHGWGIALDLNASTNRLGSKGDIHPDIVKVFEDHGWRWGGRFPRPDPMHFQACYDY